MSTKVLVDSSVWIDFFSGRPTEIFDQLLREDLVVTNELILTELLAILEKDRQAEVIDGLLALPVVELDIDWFLIRQMQIENLKAGINKVGIPDLIILQQVIQNNLALHSFDKHFKLMAKVFKYSTI